MRCDLYIEFFWIPQDFGGHRFGPWQGMRLGILWQRHLEAHLECRRDIQCEILEFDEESRRGKAQCYMPSIEEIPAQWLEEGELIALLGGFNVLAVGKIFGGV